MFGENFTDVVAPQLLSRTLDNTETNTNTNMEKNLKQNSHKYCWPGLKDSCPTAQSFRSWTFPNKAGIVLAQPLLDKYIL